MSITYSRANTHAAESCPTYRAQCSVNSLQWDYTETATSGGATATSQIMVAVDHTKTDSYTFLSICGKEQPEEINPMI